MSSVEALPEAGMRIRVVQTQQPVGSKALIPEGSEGVVRSVNGHNGIFVVQVDWDGKIYANIILPHDKIEIVR